MERLELAVEAGITKMPFRHEGKILTAVHPFYGPANFGSLQNQITSQGLRVPTFKETVSFIHEYFGVKGHLSKDVLRIMRKSSFIGFTGIFYDFEAKTAYFIDNPRFDDHSLVDVDDLAGRMNEAYARVHFDEIQKSFSIEEGEVSQNKYLTALAGEEGAEKISDIASEHSEGLTDYWWLPNFVKIEKSVASVTSLGSSRGDLRARAHSVYVNSPGCWDGKTGYAFGILDS